RWASKAAMMTERRSSRWSIALIFAAFHSSSGSSTVVLTMRCPSSRGRPLGVIPKILRDAVLMSRRIPADAASNVSLDATQLELDFPVQGVLEGEGEF